MKALRALTILPLGALASGDGVGDFVASGLGLPNSTTTESDTSSERLPSSTLRAASTAPSASAFSTGLVHGNVSVDECWSSWENFWSWRYDKTHVFSTPAETTTGAYTYTLGANASTGETLTQTIDTTETIDNGGFAISTETIHTTSLSTEIQSAIPTSTFTSDFTYTSYSTFNEQPTNTVTRPSCRLPSEVSQCQTQWERWISTVLNHPSPTPPPGCDFGTEENLPGRTVPPCAVTYGSQQASYLTWSDSQSDKMPACTQASIGGSLCESIRDDYVQMQAEWFAPPAYETAYFFSAGYLGQYADPLKGDFQPSYSWPTSQTLEPAPSCTLGCGRCAVTGGTVDLLYWPSHTATDGPEATGPVTVKTLGTTLTSPTLYISYSNLYASNGCSGVGTTISSTIVPIPTTDTLSSVYAGTIECDAHMRMTQVWTASASFNVADLQQQPVPYSIYSSQPWCQTYLRNQGCKGTCPTDTPYKPIVVVPQDVLRGLQPEWAECFGDIRGAYDPPKALQPVAIVPGPTEPGVTGDSAPKTTTEPDRATPGEGPGPTTPVPTGGAGPNPTANPDPQSDQDPGLTRGGSGDTGQTGGANGGSGQATQNAGGVVASLLGSGDDGADPATATTIQNAGGVVASLLGGGTGTAATDLQGSGAQGNGAQGNGAQGSGAQGQTGPANTDGDSDPGSGGSADDPTDDGGSNSAGSSQTGEDNGSDPNSTPSSANHAGGAGNSGSDGSSPVTMATIGSGTATIAAVTGPDGSSDFRVAYDGIATTLMPGEVMVVNGESFSMASNGALVYGTGNGRSTLAIATEAASSEIASSSSPSASSSGPLQATGNTAGKGFEITWTATAGFVLVALLLRM